MGKYDDVLAEFERESSDTALRTSTFRGSHADPDQAAEIQRLAKEHNLPKTTVGRHLREVKRRNDYSRIDFDELQRSAPKLSQFLQDPDNAEIALDDVEVLARMEQRQAAQPSFWGNLPRAALERTAELTGNFVEYAGRALTSAGQATEQIMGEGLSATLRAAPGADIDPGGALTDVGEAVSEGAPGSFGYEPMFTWERFKGDLTPKNLAGYIVEQGVRSLPDMLATIGALPAYIASRTEEIAEVRAGDEDTTAADLTAATLPAVTVSLLERLGAMSVFRGKTATSYRGALRETGRAAGTEGLTEFLQEGVEYLGERVGTGVELNAAEMLDRQLAGLVAGSGFGGGIRATTATGEAFITGQRQSKIVKEAINRLDSAARQEQLDADLADAADSKLRQRAPERFEQLQQSAVDREVYVSPDRLREMRDEGFTLPPEVETQLEQSSGADVAVLWRWPLTNPDVAARLRDSVRATPEGMTQPEIAEGGVETVREALRAAQTRAAERSALDTAVDRYVEQAVATGRLRPADARKSVEPIRAYVQTAAERRGLPVEDVLAELDLEIQGPETQSEPSPAEIEERTLPQLRAEGITLEEQRVVEETGEVVTIEQDAQQVFDRTAKRRNMVARLRDCVRAA